MSFEKYRQHLLELEKTLAGRTGRSVADGRQGFLESVHDLSDESVADEAASEKFSEAEADSAVLTQVRDALARIENGTFGTCVVDGDPIGEKRLEAIPWTRYCLKHEEAREGARAKTPTL